MTYQDGSQDVGVWQAEWIKRLYSHVPEASLEYSIKGIDGSPSVSRAMYGMKGPVEISSEKLIDLCAHGDTVQVQILLEGGEICVDVADNVGNTALIAAAKNCHLDVISVLLDNGADINKMNDAGASALTTCYYQLYEKVGGSSEGSEDPKSLQPAIQLRDDFDRHTSQFKDVFDMKFLERMSRMSGWSSVKLYSAARDRESFDRARSSERGMSNSEMASECEEHDAEYQGITNRDSAYRISTTMEVAVLNWRSPLEIRSTIHLLLSRGANPNSSRHPLPPLFYTIKYKDIPASRLLLKKGASPTMPLSTDVGGEAPLHVAVKLCGQKVVRLVELLLEYGADPNQRMLSDPSSDPFKQLERHRSSIQTVSSAMSCNMANDDDTVMTPTPLHVACTQLDNHKLMTEIVTVLLKHGGNCNLIAHGHSPLSLSIGSGNDQVVDLLLSHGADPNLPLGQGIGSALCAVTALHSQRRRSTEASIHLINKLVEHGSNVFLPIRVSSRTFQGTAVDYAYWAFNQDKHISQLPYNALTKDERQIYNGRRKVLQHIASTLRDCASTMLSKQLTELDLLTDEVIDGGLSPEPRCDTTEMVDEPDCQRGHSMSTISECELKERESCPSERIPMFITPLLSDYQGHHAKKHKKKHCSPQEKAGRTVMLPLLRTNSSKSMPAGSTKFRQNINFHTQQSVSSLSLKSKRSLHKETELQIADYSHTEYSPSLQASPSIIGTIPEDCLHLESPVAAGAFHFCDPCGRSGGVKLRNCPRCKRAYYCSRVCRTKHRDECALARKNDKGRESTNAGLEKEPRKSRTVQNWAGRKKH
jgi:ankyrin repeat protein